MSRRLREAIEHAQALPEGPGDLPPPPSGPRIVLHVSEHLRTAPNSFGLIREYRRRPITIPDISNSFSSFVVSPSPPKHQCRNRSILDIIYPFKNISSFLFLRYHLKGSGKKTRQDREDLRQLLLDPLFKPEDINGVNFDDLERELALDRQSPWSDRGWRSDSVTIETARRRGLSDPEPDRSSISFVLRDVHYRPLIHVLRSTVQEDPASTSFHWHPFQQYWKPPYPEFEEQRIYNELYSSNAFLEAERDVLAKAPKGPDEPPPVVAAFMIWSDATHVAQFGDAKLWPAYVYFGNQSHYARGRPTAKAAHHVAFFPSLPDSFNDFLQNHGIRATEPLLTHCRRELFHAVWSLLLNDPEFLDAYENGIVLTCLDGVKRRVYIRIFTYSADYPEKILIATLRNIGTHLCPRCLVVKSNIFKIATSEDMKVRMAERRYDDEDLRSKVSASRKLLYEEGYVVNSQVVNNILKDGSYVPTVNAFSRSLRVFKFDIFVALVVDLMHELELGVWKSLLVHIVRILEALPPDRKSNFDLRFRQVPTFGRSTIRRFATNVSEMKKLAARDFEDILQCCIPCLEGVIDEPHGSKISDVLYLLVYWHSLAKLRMHCDLSLNLLERVQTQLGKALRYFAFVTCAAFETFETDKEFAARKRNESRRLLTGPIDEAQPSQSRMRPAPNPGKRRKTFNLNTPKVHSMPDYPSTIRRYGVTDSYSTKTGELEHRQVKRRYAQTNRNSVVSQIVNIDVRERTIDRMTEELEAALSGDVSSGDEEEVDIASMESHHQIAQDETEKINLPVWLSEHAEDPAFKNFSLHLKAHIIGRLDDSFDSDYAFSESQLAQLRFHNNVIYPHATATFNYTRYDVMRDCDTINVNRSRRDIMIKASGEGFYSSERFWYARVLGVYHAKVYYRSAIKPQRINFLWVRWFQDDLSWPAGPSHLRLERIGFVSFDSGDSDPFGFVDPADVLRGCHLIPTFSLGITSQLLARSMARDFTHGDWMRYYVGCFVDRDMMMRYLGLGVGHLNSPDFPHEVWDLAEVEDAPATTDTPATTDVPATADALGTVDALGTTNMPAITDSHTVDGGRFNLEDEFDDWDIDEDPANFPVEVHEFDDD
ncbi:hypothetical protein FISHEDRAFT_40613 [Fistulina hepatica ATCC 64428]|uniref:Uncharacterized protein n=1 Tax=Fistulina hepatica ATCC 64428 TaxID=1128425 RepID=A0A0D7AG40_9AGAR|nr:hypothetical protein FISHEDRAFT_40613 [Fistulina hepatica ATCC 64428]